MSAVPVSEQLSTIEAWRQRLIDIIMAMPEPPSKKKMTYEEFLAWADEDTLAEWVDGEVEMYTPASDRHQDIVGFLGSVLRSFVEARQLGVVRNAPFQMKLEHSGREPDLLFIGSGHLDRLRATYLEGPADLVIEIVSPESIGRDRGEKFYEYERAGIREYWLIDPLRQWAEFYNLDEQGYYRPTFTGNSGVFHSQAVPGFWLRVDWLWQPPRVVDVLREMGVI